GARGALPHMRVARHANGCKRALALAARLARAARVVGAADGFGGVEVSVAVRVGRAGNALAGKRVGVQIAVKGPAALRIVRARVATPARNRADRRRRWALGVERTVAARGRGLDDPRRR